MFCRRRPLRKEEISAGYAMVTDLTLYNQIQEAKGIRFSSDA